VVLFLCTGNYYRSRFAEELWRHLDGGAPSGWRADSAGLSLAAGFRNVGPISPYTLARLRRHGVWLGESARPPRQVERKEITDAAHVVAVCASEHERMVQELFPDLAARVEYWDVEDVAYRPPEAALDQLEARVRELRSRLSACADAVAGGARGP
jgi:protein-tyrosine phosphatase